ncbi:MAG: hypothetical protein LKF52_03325 [Butyrivibrio sp.]|jgi:hypothetical protein|nr:hypothetical protein [Butyrivibrio sp.]
MSQGKEQQSVKLTYSSIVSAGGKPLVAITFERGSDVAEGIMPEGRIRSSSGFSEEEVHQLSAYLIQNKDQIMQEARKISSLNHLLS